MATTSTDPPLPGAQAEPQPGTVAATPTQAIAVATDLSAVELRRIRRILLMAFLLAAFTAVYFARDVLLPIVLATVLFLTLLPVVRWGERAHVPAAVTAVAVMAVIAVALFLAGYFLSGPIAQLAADGPRVAEALQDRLDGVMDRVRRVQEATAEVTGAAATATTVAGAEPSTAPEVAVVVDNGESGYIASLAGGAASGVGSVVAALLLTMFMLASGDFYHRRIVEAAPRLRDKKKALTIIRDVERQISRYLGSITLINAGLGVAVTAALWALGMPTPVVWGVLAFLLNYIPFVGNVLNVILVAAVSLVTFDTLWGAILPPAALVGLMLLESNVLTPIVVGRRLELNLVSQLVVVAFWTWLWGLAGAILAVPFLVVIKAIADNVESLQTLASFLSAEPHKPDEAPQKGTTGPALDTGHPATLAEARAESPPTVAPGEERVTPLPPGGGPVATA